MTEHEPELRSELAELRDQMAALAAQRELIENLLAVARAAPDASMVEATLHKMLEVAIRLTAATNGSLFLLNQDGSIANSILTRGNATREQRVAIIGSVMERGLSGWVRRNRTIGLIADTQTDERWFTLPYEPYSFRSALAVPILRGEQLLGILNLLHSAPGHFTQQHAHLMDLTAAQLGLAIENARLYSAAQQELADRRRAELALQRAMQARLAETEAAVHDMRHSVHDTGSALDLLKLDLFDARVPPSTFQPGIRAIDAALGSITALLDDMLDAARLQNNALTLQPAATDLAALLAQVAERFSITCTMFGCTLELVAPPALPTAWCDARRYTRVLYNVLHNAIKYASIRDDGAPGHVCAALACEGAWLMCTVSDNGPGIAPDQLAQLGKRWARAGDTGSVEGSGLGLNFSIGIMRLHGGALELTSPGLGQGTTATLRLPRAPQEEG